MKVTFKNGVKDTGLASIARPYSEVYMKLKGKVFGCINPPTAFGGSEWSIGFMTIKDKPDDNPNSNWKWVFFKKHFEELDEAKAYIQEKIDWVLENYTLRYMED